MGRGENNLLYNDSFTDTGEADAVILKMIPPKRAAEIVQFLESSDLDIFWEGLIKASEQEDLSAFDFMFNGKEKKTQKFIGKISAALNLDVLSRISENPELVNSINKELRKHNNEIALSTLIEKIRMIKKIRSYVPDLLQKKEHHGFMRDEEKRERTIINSFIELEKTKPVLQFPLPIVFIEEKAPDAHKSSHAKTKGIVHIEENRNRSFCKTTKKAESDKQQLSVKEISEMFSGHGAETSYAIVQLHGKEDLEPTFCNCCKERYIKHFERHNYERASAEDGSYILEKRVSLRAAKELAEDTLEDIDCSELKPGAIINGIIKNNINDTSLDLFKISEIFKETDHKSIFNEEDQEAIEDFMDQDLFALSDKDLRESILSLPQMYAFGGNRTGQKLTSSATP